ncbi:hypothetical protein DFQ15_111113 [Xylophilus ampelinus]|uniref:Uncharacterized protein n=1 Tax=Xylophilus ampelinus TaxID=54067 RepID=A0A318SLH2_9BURK|nr:hypothetical protein DFQ15_111113 [Xylophilus ampelinus]
MPPAGTEHRPSAIKTVATAPPTSHPCMGAAPHPRRHCRAAGSSRQQPKVPAPKPLGMRRGAQRQADQGSRCLTGAKRREFSETPPAASTAGCPQRSGGTQHAGSPFFGSFLWRSKERDSPAGAKSPPPDPTRAAQRQAAAPSISRARPSPQPSPKGRGSKTGEPGRWRNSCQWLAGRARPSPLPSPRGRGSKTGEPPPPAAPISPASPSPTTDPTAPSPRRSPAG